MVTSHARILPQQEPHRKELRVTLGDVPLTIRIEPTYAAEHEALDGYSHSARIDFKVLSPLGLPPLASDWQERLRPTALPVQNGGGEAAYLTPGQMEGISRFVSGIYQDFRSGMNALGESGRSSDHFIRESEYAEHPRPLARIARTASQSEVFSSAGTMSMYNVGFATRLADELLDGIVSEHQGRDIAGYAQHAVQAGQGRRQNAFPGHAKAREALEHALRPAVDEALNATLWDDNAPGKARLLDGFAQNSASAAEALARGIAQQAEGGVAESALKPAISRVLGGEHHAPRLKRAAEGSAEDRDAIARELTQALARAVAQSPTAPGDMMP